jgi:hypothetical protein
MSTCCWFNWHLSIVHVSLFHLSRVHLLLGFLALVHLALVHLALVPLALVHLALVHLALDTFPLFHLALVHLALVHLALVLALVHLALVHLALDTFPLFHLALVHLALVTWHLPPDHLANDTCTRVHLALVHLALAHVLLFHCLLSIWLSCPFGSLGDCPLGVVTWRPYGSRWRCRAACGGGCGPYTTSASRLCRHSSPAAAACCSLVRIFPHPPSHWSRPKAYSLRHHLIGPVSKYIP